MVRVVGGRYYDAAKTGAAARYFVVALAALLAMPATTGGQQLCNPAAPPGDIYLPTLESDSRRQVVVVEGGWSPRSTTGDPLCDNNRFSPERRACGSTAPRQIQTVWKMMMALRESSLRCACCQPGTTRLPALCSRLSGGRQQEEGRAYSTAASAPEAGRRNAPHAVAAANGRAALCAALLPAGGADPAATTDRFGYAALHRAVVVPGGLRFLGKDGAADCCEQLLCAGVSSFLLSGSVDIRDNMFTFYAPEAIAALLAFDIPMPPTLGPEGVAAVRATLPMAISNAQRQLDALQSPGTLAAATALLAARLLEASSSSSSEGTTSGCPLTQLRLLLSGGGLQWEEAWKHAPAEQRRTRFSWAVDRLAWAQAVLACAPAAEAAAAERAVTVLRLRGAALPRSREQDKLTYAAARCVAKWWDVKRAGVAAQRELSAAGDGVEEARAQGEATLARLRLLQAAEEEAAGGAAAQQ